MLRRSFVPSLGGAAATTFASSSSFFCFSATTAIATSAARGVFAFTEQSPIFANNAKHLKYTSNVWLETDKDAYWYSKRTALKSADEKPTEATVERIFEYYNGDCLADHGDQQLVADLSAKNRVGAKKELGDAINNQQLSFSSGKALSHKVAIKLADVATGRQYKSNVWLPVSFVRAKKLRVLPYAKTTQVIVGVPGKFVNADQFKDPAAIARAPVSAYKRSPFGGVTAEKLEKDIKKNNYASGLYFTISQLELFNLTDSLKSSAIPVTMEVDNISNNNNNNGFEPKDIQTTLYNIMDVEGGQELLKELNRFPVDAHTFAISGKPIVQKDVLAAIGKSDASVKSKYWVTPFELKQRNKTVVGGAKPVEVKYQFTGNNNNAKDAKPEHIVSFYSVYDLKDPAEGFKVAGTKATNFIGVKKQ